MGTHARRFSQTYCRSDLQSARDWHTVPLSTLTPIEVNKEAERSGRAGFRRFKFCAQRSRTPRGTWARRTSARSRRENWRDDSLILHRKGDTNVRVENGRYLAQHVPGAKYVELPDVDHLLQAFEQNVMDTMLDEVEEFITGTHQRSESDRVLATVMFTDIVESTARAAALRDQRWRELLARYYDLVRKELVAFRGREVKTVGDCLLASFDGPARAIRCACGLRDKVREVGLEVRTGLHTGECDLIGNDVGGLAVHIGARVANEANAAEVLVSSTVKDLVVGSGIKFVDRGTQTLKGVPGEWHLFLAR
jgi:class 3 adenylate cyclase